MREMLTKASMELENQIRAETEELLGAAKDKETVFGKSFAMDDETMEVLEEGTIKLESGETLQIAKSRAEARPPFEWLYEITSKIDEGDYFKHYLIRDKDIVLARRRDLLPIDDAEAKVILADFAIARKAL